MKKAKPKRKPRTMYLVEITDKGGRTQLSTDALTSYKRAVAYGRCDIKHFGGTFHPVEFREVME